MSSKSLSLEKKSVLVFCMKNWVATFSTMALIFFKLVYISFPLPLKSMPFLKVPIAFLTESLVELAHRELRDGSFQMVVIRKNIECMYSGDDEGLQIPCRIRAGGQKNILRAKLIKIKEINS